MEKNPQFLFPFLLTFLAGLATTGGGFVLLFPFFSGEKFFSFFLGFSAGVMIYLSFIELLAQSFSLIGFVKANFFFFLGFFLMFLLDFFSHPYLEQKISKKQKKQTLDFKLFSTGLFVTLSLSLHNLPEGLAVFLGSWSNVHLGLLLALAIAIHNIPEGITVATLIFQATHQKIKAIKYAFLVGMTEPLGATIAFLFFGPYFTSKILSGIFAFVAGVMVYVSFDEILPICLSQKNNRRMILGLAIGMITATFFLH